MVEGDGTGFAVEAEERGAGALRICVSGRWKKAWVADCDSSPFIDC
jgi:hypothetical protein